MKTSLWPSLLLLLFLNMTVESGAQAPTGALAIDERQGDQWGWAVDYETAAAASAQALRECGTACSVVLTFGRCAAYAADQDADSTAVGWAEAYASGDAARQAALSECRSRGGGSGCVVRAWGCNSPVVEEGLNLDLAVRRQIQQGLVAAGFDPGGADGLFGPRTRAAIRRWQASRGTRSTGYLDGVSAEALRSTGVAGPAVGGVAPAAPTAVPAAQQSSPASTTSASAAASAELEGLFWQSIMNSTNPAEFEAYLAQFPNGVFSALAQTRLAALRSAAAAAPPGGGPRVAGAGAPPSGSRVSGAQVSGTAAPGLGTAAGGDVVRGPGDVFRDCAECPEMVVLAGGNLAMGRYEVTVGEYRAFASATGGGAGGRCIALGDSWRDPGFPQTDRHPVTCVSWDDAQAYVSWLSERTGMEYRLPTEAEWHRAAAGSQRGCDRERTGNRGTCPVGSYGSNAAGLSDMVGNLLEWVEDCVEGDCGRRVKRGGSWLQDAEHQRSGARFGSHAGYRLFDDGFRVSRTLD